MSSSVRPSVVCLYSVTFVRPTRAIEIFGNISTPFGTLAICWHPAGKILRRSSQGNPSVGGDKHNKIEDRTLYYGLDVCPSNSADRHSLQFSVNKIIYKIFGAMATDSYGQISEYFGIPSVEQLITNRHNRFLNRYRCQENYLCQALA